MAQGIVPSSRPRSSRAAAALATMAKGDDKLTRKAEEQAAKVRGQPQMVSNKFGDYITPYPHNSALDRCFLYSFKATCYA